MSSWYHVPTGVIPNLPPKPPTSYSGILLLLRNTIHRKANFEKKALRTEGNENSPGFMLFLNEIGTRINSRLKASY